MAEQRCFTDGRIVVHGDKAFRRKGKRADYILRYTRDFPIAVVEAKPEDQPAATGLQQAIIGRGTRVRDDYGKLWFNILDYTGAATRNFADPAFDGDPALATQEEIDEYGQTTDIEVVTPEESEFEDSSSREEPPVIVDYPPGDRQKFYYDAGRVEIATELVYELDWRPG